LLHLSASKVKQRINPALKTRLIRVAFYLLLLVAICATPIALAHSQNHGRIRPVGVARSAPAAACSWITEAPVPYNASGIFAVSDGTWTALPPTPDQHYRSQAVYSNGKIYNMGGFGVSGVTNTTRIFDIGGWTTGAPMPVALSDMATVLWNGIIYVGGGYNGSGAVNTLYVYNIATNSWSTLAPMPQALYGPGFGAINGKLYIASGNNGTSELNTLYIYDIATNTWTTGANVPTAVTGPGSTQLRI
jgi:hypothetical protein